jgi:hypothetical protein
MCSRRWLSAACKVAGLRRGSDDQTSHHSSAHSSNRRRDPLGSTQAPRSLDASSLASQRRATPPAAPRQGAARPPPVRPG